MKYAISSVKDNIISNCDSHFARSSFFAIHDTSKHQTSFIANPFKNTPEKAGPSVVELLESLNVQVVVSSDLGEKIKNHFTSKKIGMIILNDETKTIKEIITLINNNKNINI